MFWPPRKMAVLHPSPLCKSYVRPSRRWPAELNGTGWRTDHQSPSPAQAPRLKGKRNTRTQNPHQPNAPAKARTSTMPIAARRDGPDLTDCRDCLTSSTMSRSASLDSRHTLRLVSARHAANNMRLY